MRRSFVSYGFSLGLAASVVVALVNGGCQVLVPGDVAAFKCMGTDLSACPAGTFCARGDCLPCTPKGTDVCDGLDNDCSGKVDDSPLEDSDKDGFARCGTFDPVTGAPNVDPQTGRFIGGDCDDTDPAVHPGATDVCNGVDDDCDGVRDNGGDCGPGSTCSLAGGCVRDDQACTTTKCAPPQVCDEKSLKCVNQNQELGFPCASDASCKKGYLCGVDDVLTTTITSQTQGPVCTKTCCTSADCPSDFVCYAPGTSGRFCVLKKYVALRDVALGGGGPGSVCTKATDCRSGNCYAFGSSGSRCIDTCCKDNDCAAGSSCTLTALGKAVSFQCAPTVGTSPGGTGCSSNAKCASGYCGLIFDYIFSTDSRCAAPCCGSSTCPSDVMCFNNKLSGSGAEGVTTACDEGRSSSGTGMLGATCRSSSDCRSNRCNAVRINGKEEQRCVDACCTDSDCAAAGPGWACRAATLNPYGKVLRCLPE